MLATRLMVCLLFVPSLSLTVVDQWEPGSRQQSLVPPNGCRYLWNDQSDGEEAQRVVLVAMKYVKPKDEIPGVPTCSSLS